MNATRRVRVFNASTACDLVGELIDRSLRAEREFLAAAMIDPPAALRAAIDADLCGTDFVADHHSAVFRWACLCAANDRPWRALEFVQAARSVGIDVCEDDLFFQFQCDSMPRELPTHAAAIKDYSNRRRRAQYHFRALDDLGVCPDDRRLIDARYAPKPKHFSPQRRRRRAGSRFV